MSKGNSKKQSKNDEQLTNHWKQLTAAHVIAINQYCIADRGPGLRLFQTGGRDRLLWALSMFAYRCSNPPELEQSVELADLVQIVGDSVFRREGPLTAAILLEFLLAGGPGHANSKLARIKTQTSVHQIRHTQKESLTASIEKELQHGGK